MLHEDETYIKVKGEWVYLYRAVDKEGDTVDFLLTKKRDKKAATRFFKKAIRLNGAPEKVTIDKSGANTAALNDMNEERVKAGKQTSGNFRTSRRSKNGNFRTSKN